MKYHDTNETIRHPQSIALSPGQLPSIRRPLAEMQWALEARAAKLQLLISNRAGRRPAYLKPPRARRRIYTESELASATAMFLKLRQGEDRRPRPAAPTSAAQIRQSNPDEPLDRIVDTLLDVFEL